MSIVYVIILSCVSLLVLFGLCKLIGQRQIGQMDMFDYVNSITIGSIAAELATNLEEWEKPFTALLLYGFATAAVDWLVCRNLKLRKFVNGRPLVLYEDDKLYEANLAKAKLDIGEFLTQCRVAGYFDLAQLQTVMLEPGGQFSFLPKADQRPATPNDLSLTPAQESPFVNLILDGRLLGENLRAIGKNEVWLKKQLHSQGIGQVSDVFLAVCDKSDNFCAWRRQPAPQDKELFE